MAFELLKRLWSHVGGDSPAEDASAYLSDGRNWKTFGGTCLSGAAYHEARMILAVRFAKSGKVYWYLNVWPLAWKQLVAATSKGKFYTSSIRNNYEYRGPIG